MRKLLISLLLASAAATPALADPDHNDHQNARAERSESRSQAHEGHSQRAAPVERPQFNGQSHVNGAAGGGGNGFNGAVNASGHAHFNDAMGGQGRFNGVQQVGQADAVQNEQAAVRNAEHNRGPHVVNNPNGNARDWRDGERRGFNGQQDQVVEQGQQVRSGGPHTVVNDTLRQSDRPLPNVMRTHNRSLLVSDVPRPGTQPPLRTDGRHTEAVHWNTNWRNDGHHDWHDWRRHHHSWFHLGFYYDPFGWGYQPYSVGWRMWPNYYSSSFWINDPWQYRLPYAPPGTQWVRYYNDAVLVDTYTGEVIDVVYNFFW
jgi:Ni/Co efflux regulator RcnB